MALDKLMFNLPSALDVIDGLTDHQIDVLREIAGHVTRSLAVD